MLFKSVPLKESDKQDCVVMRFIDAPMGCRFRYRKPSPEKSRIWIKIGIDDCGVIAEYDARWMDTPNWTGQQICSFAETEADMRMMEIEVIG